MGAEALDAWETSSGGPFGYRDVHFEAIKIGNEEGLGDCSVAVGVHGPTVMRQMDWDSRSLKS